MLDEHNPLAKKFRAARDRLKDHESEEFIIRILGAAEGDPVQYNLPSTDELAMLVVGDFSLDNFKRDNPNLVIYTRFQVCTQLTWRYSINFYFHLVKEAFKLGFYTVVLNLEGAEKGAL